MRRYALIEAPSLLGLKPTGVDRLPARLLELGLADRIDARRAARLAASMDLAFATGHGPDLLTDLEGRKPLVREEDAFAFAFRDAEEQAEYGSQPLPPGLRAFDLQAVRCLGVAEAARQAVAHLTRPELDGFFIHVDADSVDDALMPAVDYRLPDGLTWAELRETLTIALASGKAAGLEIAIYNPALDPDGAAGRGLVETLASALGTAPGC